jgi:hypothetical protein
MSKLEYLDLSNNTNLTDTGLCSVIDDQPMVCNFWPQLHTIKLNGCPRLGGESISQVLKHSGSLRDFTADPGVEKKLSPMTPSRFAGIAAATGEKSNTYQDRKISDIDTKKIWRGVGWRGRWYVHSTGKRKNGRGYKHHVTQYDPSGYDYDGYNQAGFNRRNQHRNNTKYDDDGYDVDGFDAHGFNKNNRDRDGRTTDESKYDKPS